MILSNWIAFSFILDAISIVHADTRRRVDEKSEKNILNVHIVPHTHDDVGWLKTVEQYYYGQNITIRQACVSCILDNIMYALQLNPSRKFTYVEMAFFTMWWEEQSTDMKNIVRNLVKNGQLSFANGGWCMHDEATTHFMGMIDQTTLGHEFLKKEFNYVPSVGWQLDPFGHSATQASLLTSEVGFNALYFGRIDYQDLQQRHSQRNCEGIWDASPNLVDNSVFWGLTGSFSGNYGAPEGFCFDILCDEDPLYGMEEDAMKSRLEDFLKQVKVQSDRSIGKNIMLTMGSDFQFENANFNFKSLDLLIDTINTKMDNVISTIFPNFDGLNLLYSTPEMYTQYKYNEYIQDRQHGANQTSTEPMKGGLANLQVKDDDFFPYSDCDHCFWTGYFTSRPALKRLERVGSALLQAARQIQAFYKIPDDPNYGEKEIGVLERGVAIAQHHDGVSGTSKQHVAYDYAKKIQAGINEAGKFMASFFERKLSGGDIGEMMLCQLRNESKCEISQRQTMNGNSEFYVVVYNALGWTRREIISIPVNMDANYSVLQEQHADNNVWKEIPSVLMPNFNYAKVTDAAPYNLIIDVEIGALSAIMYRIKMFPKESVIQRIDNHALFMRSKTSRGLRPATTSNSISNGEFVVKNGDMEVHFSSGAMTKIVRGDMEVGAVSEWGYYTSFDDEDQNSGAYIFRPKYPNQELNRLAPIPSSIKIIENNLLTEVHSTFEGNWIHQIARIYKGKLFLDIEYTVGPVPIDDGIGKEVVNCFRTAIVNNGTFFTDSNGREFLNRKRSERKTWDFEEFEPIAGNYYPVNTAIFIEDDNASLTVLTDRTQGGSSLKDGSIELMVHRRILKDDARGVDESLNETSSGINAYPPYGDASRIGDGLIITGTHRVLLSDGKSGAIAAREEMDKMFSPPFVFAAANSRATTYRSQPYKHHFFSFDGDFLPSNVQLLTTKLLSTDEGGRSTILIRLGHSYGEGESNEFSKEVIVDLSDLFPLIKVTEKTLTGNQDKSRWNKNKMKWGGKGNVSSNDKLELPVVLLRPMEIRTFEIVVKSEA